MLRMQICVLRAVAGHRIRTRSFEGLTALSHSANWDRNAPE